MAHHILVKLPADHSFQDVQNFEIKVTTNSGVELISNSTASDFEYLTVEHSFLVAGGKDDPEDRERIVSKVPCIELNVLTKEETESKVAQRMDSLAEITRKASLTTNNLPSVHTDDNNTVHFKQQKEAAAGHKVLEFSLVVPQQEREFHSLPETNTTLKPVQISRPHSDTDVTKPLHIKGGEKIVTQEPCFESLSFSVDADNEEQYYPYTEENTTTVDVPIGTVPFYIPESPTTPKVEDISTPFPTTPKAKNSPSDFLMLGGPTEATQNGMPSRKLVGSSTDLSYHLRNEFENINPFSAMVFPSAKPYVLPGTGGQIPDVFVEYTCKPDIWPLHQYTENPMRYNVGKLPKKSMNNVYYSLDESFAFKEEMSKVLLIEKKEIFEKITNLNPNTFVPIIAYLRCIDDQRRKFGYQMMEYYKDGSTHDIFKVNVNGVNCTCFIEIYHQKHEEYAKIRKQRDSFRRPYMFSAPEEYQCGLEALNKRVSVLSNELENLMRNFNAVIVQMLKAVGCLHFNGLVHRDIKPHNFLVKRIKPCKCQPLILCSCEEPGFCILLGDYDFVSLATNQKWDFTKTKFDYSKKSIKRGTFGYRPIELNFDNEGDEICDPKSDIYSLGVSIMEILAGSNWETCESDIDEILKTCMSPLSDKCKKSTSLQQFQDDLCEKFITLQEKNTYLQSQGVFLKELSEINGILAFMCTEESYPNIKHTVEQFKVIVIEKDDGIQNVLKTVIKAKHVDGRCAIHSWQVVESKWICNIIQHCVKAHPQKRPCIQELLKVT